MGGAFDIDAYLGRIGYTGSRLADLDTLRGLHLAHVTHVPFENLDLQMGVPIRLDLEHLQDKIVRRSRGGYCFEQNTLFQSALRALGFGVAACEARVRSDSGGEVRPRTHMVLVVRLDGPDWLCDVGFGGDGLLEPLPLDFQPHLQHGRALRVAREDGDLVLQDRPSEAWRDLYVFRPEARYPIDFEVANWYTSTHPESIFLRALTAQRSTPEARHVLRGLTYTVRSAGRDATREIGREELIPLLRDVFGIDLPEGTRFRALDATVGAEPRPSS